MDGFNDDVSAVTVGVFGLTIKAKFCVLLPAPLVAVKLMLKVPLVAGIPATVAVPLLLAVKETPPGRAPASVMVGVGNPVEFTVNVLALPTRNDAPAALVNAGG